MTYCRPSFFAFLLVALIATPRSAVNAEPKVLVFTRTTGFRHGSIDRGAELIQELGAANGFSVDRTESSRSFTEENLEAYSAVVWLNTTGNVLGRSQQTAFENFIQNGGGYVGVHSASDTEYDWPWYGDLLGGDAWFRSHPSQQTAIIDIEDRDHISTSHLDETWSHLDEWYNFRRNPRDSVNVLMSVREDSYSPGANAMGDHPIAWYHEFDGDRSWYTGLGHRNDVYDNPLFQQHLLGGIQYAVPEPSTGMPCLLAVLFFGVAIRRRRPSGLVRQFEPASNLR